MSLGQQFPVRYSLNHSIAQLEMTQVQLETVKIIKMK